VNLAAEYKRQFAWRDWPAVLSALPPVRGQTIVDLGCGIGDVAAELVARGARVVGIDGNDELLREARARGLAVADFVKADLRHLPDLGVRADGLWCSFAAAYFPDLADELEDWTALLRAGAWVALTEIDDLFGHEPLDARVGSLLEAYVGDALHSGRYDCHMGRKLAGHAARAGLEVERVFDVADRELSFRGPADPDVLVGWRARFDRMTLLRDFCGREFDRVRESFLACLARADHRSRARVVCCIARLPVTAPSVRSRTAASAGEQRPDGPLSDASRP
jgi:SAM-dependent methyltransferase